MQALPCAPGTCADNAPYADVLRALDAANEVFRGAGLQFWIRSFERHHLPSFADIRTTPTPACCVDPVPCQACQSGCAGGGAGSIDRLWSAVKAEMMTVFPATPSNGWLDSTVKNNRMWMRSVETVYGKDDEMVVWVVAQSCNVYASAIHEGRHIVMNGAALAQPYKLAHELGHYFGMTHTWDDDTNVDPWSGAAHVRSDRWDLVYKPGAIGGPAHTFYNSKSAAAANEASLKLIHVGGGSGTTDRCSVDAAGVTTCTIADCTPGPGCYSEVHATGSAALKGMAFSFGSGAGPNVMSYLTLGGTGSRAFADSQIQLIRRYLRWDKPLSAQAVEDIKPGATLSGRRPRLGSYDLRQEGAKLDFDGDGKRDLGVWIPPLTAGTKGTFNVLLSTKGFSTTAGQFLSASFGELGDVPVPADYTGDGK